MSSSDSSVQVFSGAIVAGVLAAVVSLVILYQLVLKEKFTLYDNTIGRHDIRIAQNQDVIRSIEPSAQGFEIETKVRAFIEQEFGEMSEREEAVAKIKFILQQQDQRLSNIEKSL